jgi:hypothetical protein
MRDINLPISQTVSFTFDPQGIDLSKAVDDGQGRRRVPLGTIFDDRISSLLETARRNGGKVLYATTSIEQKLESILLEYFMGPFTGHDDKRAMFEREILQSSALSYRAKKELVTKIVNASNLLEGSKKSTLQSHLKEIMEWRNAFAHGKIQHDTKMGCFIRYYSGEPKTTILSDDYWDEVEKTFKECDALLDEAKRQFPLNNSMESIVRPPRTP